MWRLALLAALPLATPAAMSAEPRWTHEGYVVHINDGESFTLLDKQRREQRVRLDGIDAPEKDQPFGTAARRHLHDLAYGLDVVAECRKVDRDGRDLCRVRVGEVDIAMALTRAGLAWVLTRYADELPAELLAAYTAAQAQSKAAGLGLWGAESAPVPPWQWRGTGRRLPGD
jgi:endonuclease YncB( thermonuclease family)